MTRAGRNMLLPAACILAAGNAGAAPETLQFEGQIAIVYEPCDGTSCPVGPQNVDRIEVALLDSARTAVPPQHATTHRPYFVVHHDSARTWSPPMSWDGWPAWELDRVEVRIAFQASPNYLILDETDLIRFDWVDNDSPKTNLGTVSVAGRVLEIPGGGGTLRAAGGLKPIGFYRDDWTICGSRIRCAREAVEFVGEIVALNIGGVNHVIDSSNDGLTVSLVNWPIVPKKGKQHFKEFYDVTSVMPLPPWTARCTLLEAIGSCPAASGSAQHSPRLGMMATHDAFLPTGDLRPAVSPAQAPRCGTAGGSVPALRKWLRLTRSEQSCARSRGPCLRLVERPSSSA